MASVFPAITGFISGFTGEQNRYRDEQQRQEQQRYEREQNVYATLINHGDDEMRQIGLSGLLASAGGPQKKGGIRGWLGELESNPISGHVQALLGQKPAPAMLPSRSITGTVNYAPGTAGEVSTQTTNAGEPGPSATRPEYGTPVPVPVPPTVGQPPPTSGASVAMTTGPLSTPPPGHTPRLLTPEEETARHYRGQYSGEIEGIANALFAADPNPNRDQARQDSYAAARTHMLGRLGISSIGHLGTPKKGKDATGADVTAEQDLRIGSPFYGRMIDINTLQPIEGFMETSLATQSFGTDREAISHEAAFGGIPFGKQTPEGAAKVNAEAERRKAAAAGAAASARGQAENVTALDKPIGIAGSEATGLAPTAPLRATADTVAQTQADRDKQNAATVVSTTLDEIDQLIGKVYPATGGGLLGRAQTALSLGTQHVLREPDITALDSKIASAMSGIVRLNGITQRLNTRELELAQQQLVSTSALHGDTLQSAQMKMKILRDLAARVTGVNTRVPKQVGTRPPGSTAAPAAVPAAPAKGGGSGIFQDAQGQLHIGSVTGPIYTPGGGG